MNKTIPEDLILEAALDIISQNSISNTRMHMIAERAGMAQSNLHYHFKTKRELLIAVLRQIQHTFSSGRQQFVEDQQGSLKEKLRGFFEQKKYFILHNPKYDQAQFDYWCLGQSDAEIKKLSAEIDSLWREHIVCTIHYYRPNIPIEQKKFIANAMISMMLGAALQYLNNPEAFDPETYFTLCLEMVMKIIETL